MKAIRPKLRTETSMHSSGLFLNEGAIEILRDRDYCVEDRLLDGDAPKQFIRVYRFSPDSGIHRKKTRTWIPYIAKTAEKWYPHESVIEFMINRIGQELGLIMNEVELYYINGQIRFLSRYFLKSNETLTHGAEICGEYLDDIPFAKEIANEKKSSRELFTFQFIEKAMAAKFTEDSQQLVSELVRMIIYDGLVGNNDRHFYNWGVITNTKKLNTVPRFAPLYDSARGLLWNSSDDWIVKNFRAMSQNGKKIERYIKEACPRISIEEDSGIDHFGLISYLKNYNVDYSVIITEMSSLDNEDRILEMLKIEFFPFFITERCKLIEYIVRERFKRIRGL